MAKPYQPPYTITPIIIRLVSKISERLGRLAVLENEQSLTLRRVNRIRTIHGSLAIEGNTPQVKELLAFSLKAKSK